MKKFLTAALSLLLSVSAVFAFAACETSGGTGGAGGADTPYTSGDPSGDTLLVYFSWSGNTREMAEYIAAQTGAYVVEIVPEVPYSDNYNDVAYGRAQEEAEQNARPAVAQATYDLIDMERYDTVLIGFPIWWHTAPMVIGTFLEHYTWTAEDNIYPFFQGASNSNQEYYDNSMSFVRENAAGANVHSGLYCDEGDTQAIDTYLSENGLTGGTQTPETPSGENSVLVVFFSAQGHTERVAGYIAAATGGDLFELTPADPYTSEDLDYNDADSRVVQEYEAKQKGTLADVELTQTTVNGWATYETVFLGYPIWWHEAAWPVNTFVRANDFTGKTVIPFCTSASSGLGQSGEIPDSVRILGEASFRRAALAEVHIPAGVTEIRNYAFGTDSCGQIVFAGSEEEWNAIDKQPYWNLGNGEVQILFEGENDL